uniref:Uncharacterized protein n=1 Tax=Ursus americanus TaxID=9643 RepID=A0A452SSQ6_URSAM
MAKSTSRISSPESLRTNQPTLSRKACSGSLQQRTAVALAASQQRSRSPHASSAQPPPPREGATSASASSSSSGSSGGGAGATDRPSAVTPGAHMAGADRRKCPGRGLGDPSVRASVGPSPGAPLGPARPVLTWPRLGGRRSPRRAEAAGGGRSSQPERLPELLTLTPRARPPGPGSGRSEPPKMAEQCFLFSPPPHP